MLVLFDGVCQFCNSSVNFIIDNDPRKHFRFAALQSPLGKAMLRRFGLADQHIDSVLLIEKERCYPKTTAALRIARQLRSPWPVLSLFIMVPTMLRDLAYD